MRLPAWLFALGLMIGAGTAAGAREKLVLTAAEFPPHLSPSLPGSGPWAQTAARVLNEAGYELEVEFRPWTRVLGETSARREHPHLLLLRPAPGRERYFLYARPLFEVEVVLLKRQGTPFRPDQLDGAVAGTLDNAALPAAFRKLRFARMETAGTYELALRMLLAGRVDVLLIDRRVYQHLAKRMLKEADLEEVPGIVYRQTVHLGVPLQAEQAERLIRDINGAMKRLKLNKPLP